MDVLCCGKRTSRASVEVEAKVQARHPKIERLSTPESGATNRGAAGMPNRGPAVAGRPADPSLGRRYMPAGQIAPRRAPERAGSAAEEEQCGDTAYGDYIGV